MKKRILTEKTLKEATVKACETELKIYDKLTTNTKDPVFSAKFEKEIKEMMNHIQGKTK